MIRLIIPTALVLAPFWLTPTTLYVHASVTLPIFLPYVMFSGDQARESTRRSLRSRVGLCRCMFRSGGGFEGDSVAHRGELCDVVTHPVFDAGPTVVVFGSEVMEAGC